MPVPTALEIADTSWWDRRFRLSPPAVAGVWLRPCCFVGQKDGILRAGWQPALCGPFSTLRQAGYQPAAGFQPAPQAGMDSD